MKNTREIRAVALELRVGNGAVPERFAVAAHEFALAAADAAEAAQWRVCEMYEEEIADATAAIYDLAYAAYAAYVASSSRE